MGSSPSRKTSLLGIAHPFVGLPFRYRECTERRHLDEAVIVKEADMWPCVTFCKSVLYKRIFINFFLDYYINSRVCNYGIISEILKLLEK